MKNKMGDLWPHYVGCNEEKLHFYDGKQYKYPSQEKETLAELSCSAEFTAVFLLDRELSPFARDW